MSRQEEAEAAYADRLLAENIRLRQQLDALTWEHRNTGDHRMAYSEPSAVNAVRCLLCGVSNHDAAVMWPCPSKRERRRVGPWEPAEEGG